MLGGTGSEKGENAMWKHRVLVFGLLAVFAMLFTAAKVSHLALLPQGRPEAAKRAIDTLRTMDALGFGNCTNERECEAECPKEISIVNIARLNREFFRASFASDE